MKERIPPHDLDAEMSILGCIFKENTTLSLVYDKVKQEYFYVPKNGIIFKVILDLSEIVKKQFPKWRTKIGKTTVLNNRHKAPGQPAFDSGGWNSS